MSYLFPPLLRSRNEIVWGINHGTQDLLTWIYSWNLELRCNFCSKGNLNFSRFKCKSLPVSNDQLSVTARPVNKFVHLICAASSNWKKNRQLSIGGGCRIVRFFMAYWDMFTWSDCWETDWLLSSSVTSKSLNRLRSSAAISFEDSFSKYRSGVEENQNAVLTRYVDFLGGGVFIIEKAKDRAGR